MLQPTGTLCLILDGIHLYGYISMGGHIIPEAEKANMAVMDTSARPLSASYTFLSPLHAYTYSSLWEKLKTWLITVEYSCWVAKSVSSSKASSTCRSL